MKRRVSITLEIDPTEYNEAVDTPKGTVDLVIACLRQETDLPSTITVECEGHSKTTELNYLD